MANQKVPEGLLWPQFEKHYYNLILSYIDGMDIILYIVYHLWQQN